MKLGYPTLKDLVRSKRELHRLTHPGGRAPRRRLTAQLPRQQQPNHIRLGYFASLKTAILDPAHEMVETRLYPVAKELAGHAARLRGKTDADPEDVNAIMLDLTDDFDDHLSSVGLDGLARRYGVATAVHQSEQLAGQLRAAVGVEVPINDERLGPLLQQYTATNVALIRSIPARYFQQVQNVLMADLQLGKRWESIAEDLEDRFDVSQSTAQVIARDQVGKFSGALNQARQEDLGIDSFTWRDSGDNRVREEHRMLNGQTFKWAEPPEEGVPGEPVNCFPGNTPVGLFDTRVKKAYRRAYSGPLVVLTTSTGEELSATPNHPVLTGRGWLPAHLVEVGENVFQACTQGGQLAVDDPERGDPTFGEVFGALSSLGIVHRVAGLDGGFHGDVAGDQEVDVVDVDRCLSAEADVPLSQEACQHLLARADEACPPARPEYQFLLAPLFPANRLVRGARKLLTLIGAQAGVPSEHGLAARARLYALAQELGSDCGARHVEAFRDRLYALPGAMQLRHHLARVVLGVVRRAVDDIPRLYAPSAEELGQAVRIASQEERGLRQRIALQHPRSISKKIVREFEGHVFNLETVSNWYVSRSLIVHNCRCGADPVLTGLFDED